MNKDQLKAAFAKGARIQAWHLLPGATNSNQGQWDTLTPADGAQPEFGCEAHLYRVHPEDISLIAELGQEVGAVAWQWRWLGDSDEGPGPWNLCDNEAHSKLIAANSGYEVRSLYTSPAHTSEARDAEIARLCAQLADMEHGFRDMASKWSHDAAEMTHGIAATAVRSCVDEVFDFLGPDYDAAMRQESGGNG